MEITITDTKNETLKACCSELLHKNNQTIGYVAKEIDLMTSSLSGVIYGAAHYRYLEQDKTNALKISKGFFDAMMILSPQSIIDVQWWYNNINCSKNKITKSEPVIEISSDASSFGWGAVCNNIRTGGASNLDEMEYHINAKELLAAVKFSLKAFVKVPDAHVKLLSDNTTTVHGINNIHSNQSNLCHSIISEFGLGLRTKAFGLLLSTFQERRTMMQIQNDAKNIFTKIISKF